MACTGRLQAGDTATGANGLPHPTAVLPHREPFLLVDEVVAMEPGRRVEGRWRPDPDGASVDVGLGPQVPPLLVVEALAQLGAYGAMQWAPEAGIPLFAQLDRARFRRPIRPGVVLALVVEVERLHRRGGRGRGRAVVGAAAERAAVEVRLGFVFVPAGAPRPTSGGEI
jgi:3-hydroxyacyl-[acyl-carrier-protein] dehydratase